MAHKLLLLRERLAQEQRQQHQQQLLAIQPPAFALPAVQPLPALVAPPVEIGSTAVEFSFERMSFFRVWEKEMELKFELRTENRGSGADEQYTHLSADHLSIVLTTCALVYSHTQATTLATTSLFLVLSSQCQGGTLILSTATSTCR